MLSTNDVNHAVLSSLAVSVAIALIVVMTSRWHQMITADHTSGVQKVHKGITPRIGGLGIYLGMWMATLALPVEQRQLTSLVLISAAPAMLFGLLEDLTKRVGIKERLIATMLSGVAGWWLTGYSLTRLDLPLIDALLAITPIAVIFTAFAVGGVANAINLIDGFNGLAAGTLLICLTGLGFVAHGVGDAEIVRLVWIVGAATLGFLVLNFPFGKIFLGDGGAYALGFLLSWIGVMLAMRHPGAVSPAAILLICAYPVLETVFSMLRRARRKQAVDQPDLLHLHSLVYRRLVPKLMGKNKSQSRSVLRNSATSPFLWAFCAMPVTAGVLLRDNTILCWAAIALTAIAYDSVYRRLATFRWTILGMRFGSTH